MLSCTLKEIRAASPCEDGWRKLLAHLGKTAADNTSVDLETVLDSNGLDDALWVLDNVVKNWRIISLFAADCAERVLPIFERERPDDNRPKKAIEVARDAGAGAAARTAAGAAAGAAWDAARTAAGDAWDAWDAARTAWAAAGAAWAAAGAAERDAQASRLRQYLIYGETAADMPWPELEATS